MSLCRLEAKAARELRELKGALDLKTEVLPPSDVSPRHIDAVAVQELRDRVAAFKTQIEEAFESKRVPWHARMHSAVPMPCHCVQASDAKYRAAEAELLRLRSDAMAQRVRSICRVPRLLTVA